MTDVWLPGWQCSPTCFQPLWQRLYSKPPQCLSFAGAQSHWAEWLDAQVSELPASTRLIGWSLGGMLAVELARHSERVTSVLVLNANTRFYGGGGLSEPVAEGFRLRYARSPNAARRKFSALVNPDHPEDVESYLLDGDHRQTLNWLYDLRLTERCPSATVSVLLSKNDALVPYQSAHAGWARLQANVTGIAGFHDVCRTHSKAVAQWIKTHE
ncbi:alpha/beta fold hydrolase [Reinekea blandensis]|uniref:AB hydrolase-1 domain-containing protein n=1 Tax=Reinekea blandensis MED297 TaxID=314283 RepID=A4BGD6_9GAMM|nr:alpha/beta hydrolase [Reinekea blandensis]EAR08742.1 hypothetical protein MED297_08761 [Reinekea sp. MED297] [Reinekea blandensis MED297]